MNRTQDRTLGDTRTQQDTKVIHLSRHQRRKLSLRAIGLRECNMTSAILSKCEFTLLIGWRSSVSREVEDGLCVSFVVNPSKEDKKMKGSAPKWSCTFFFFFFLNLFHLNCWCFLWQEFLIELQLFLWQFFFFLISFTSASHQSLYHHQTRVALRKRPQVEPSTANIREITADTTSWKFWHKSTKGYQRCLIFQTDARKNVNSMNFIDFVMYQVSPGSPSFKLNPNVRFSNISKVYFNERLHPLCFNLDCEEMASQNFNLESEGLQVFFFKPREHATMPVGIKTHLTYMM